MIGTEIATEQAPQARLSRALAAARMIVWEYDLHAGLITHQVPRCLSPARPLPLPLQPTQALRLVHPDDRRQVLARAREAIEHCAPYVQHFRMTFTSGASAVWVEQHGSIVVDRSGRAAALLGVAIDITAHKHTLDVLAVADRRKDDFLATLAHELRNPLTAIGAAAQLLRTVELDPDRMGTCIDTIHRQAGQLYRLVDDLLDLSRVVRNRLELKRERTDLGDALTTTVQSVGELLRARRHQLNMSLPTQPLMLDADPVRLCQLLANLLINAIKYTPEGGRIDVIAERDLDGVIVRIRDSGLGIAAEHLPNVFEPFFQVQSAFEHAQGGLGIGLALVRRIAQLHGGSVSVHSAGLGLGSEFTVRLPLLSDERVAPRRGSGAVAPRRSAHPLRVLVADDNADVAETLALSLQMCGHDVQVALDGEQALRLAERFRPQAALLDLGMPKKAGHEVARELRAQPWALENGLLLVALTGWNARDLQDKLDMSAFDAQMLKPPDIETVLQLIENAGARRKPPSS